jgi:peptidoglycan/xylan/chitin deacetylase (PgdA/CDA1 family)
LLHAVAVLATRFRDIKVASLRAFKTVGGFEWLLRSAWRRKRLLILCYHGVSLRDEHEWNPSLYMAPSALESRLRILRDAGCAVLPLNAAVERLYAGVLPPRAVALTFDDGYVDFHERAYPLLKQYGMPATVYLTTRHCGTNRPVFRLVTAYMLWKARARTVDLTAIVSGPHTSFDLRGEDARRRAFDGIIAAMKARRLKPAQKDGFAAEISKHLGVDYQEIASARMFTIMVSDEVRALAAAGVQFELHTHTHVTPSEAGYFDEEIAANRTAIEQMTGVAARHFCYPSGRYRPEFLPWLQGKQVVSATTCDPGLASIHSNPLLLPRFVDVNGVTPVEFEGWISGAASFLSRQRSYGAPQ